MHTRLLRNILGLVLIAGLIFAAIGCSGKTASSSTTTTAVTSTTQTTATTSKTTTTTAATSTATTTSAGGAVDTVGRPYTPYTGKFDRTFILYQLYPMSASGATWGINAKLGQDLAIKDQNAKGGILIDGVRYKLTSQVYDTAMDTAKAAELARLVVNQNGRYVAMCSTAMVLAVMDYFGANNIFNQAQIIGQPKAIASKYPLQFMAVFGPADFGPSTYYSYIAANMGVKTIAMLNPDSDNGRIWGALVLQDVRSLNIPVKMVADEYYKPNTQDYSPIINKLMLLNPDMIDMTGAAVGEAAVFAKQARDAGYKGVLGDLCTQGDPATSWQVAGKNSTGWLTVGFAGQDPTPLYTTFRQYIEKQTNQPMYVSPPYVYDQTLAWFDAMNAANTWDPYKVAAVLQDMKWTGLYGPTNFIGGTAGSPFDIKRAISVGEPLIRFTTDGKAEWVTRGSYPFQ